jgi:hypothetical protein
MKHLSCVALVAACGTDPVSYSAPVGIELKAKSGDVAGTAISEQKDITTETGNPYGAFITDAQHQLGGHDPGALAIDQLDLVLGGQSTGVATLDQVFTGDVDVALVVNDTNNTYDAGHVSNPTGVGPVPVSAVFDWSRVADLDRAKFLGGGFKVVVRGSAAAGFASKGAEAQLETTFTFTAFQ